MVSAKKTEWRDLSIQILRLSAASLAMDIDYAETFKVIVLTLVSVLEILQVIDRIMGK